jgi:hypothetical protein
VGSIPITRSIFSMTSYKYSARHKSSGWFRVLATLAFSSQPVLAPANTEHPASLPAHQICDAPRKAFPSRQITVRYAPEGHDGGRQVNVYVSENLTISEIESINNGWSVEEQKVFPEKRYRYFFTADGNPLCYVSEALGKKPAEDRMYFVEGRIHAWKANKIWHSPSWGDWEETGAATAQTMQRKLIEARKLLSAKL